ncbi:hypothetical protein QR680_013982 [Steinernema hermaphroditum]|uniref:Peptidase M13 C-terminal domain-containing protein n=1 Tax=Steinernema hermaphroditum TaxID=289476 RepID=A0AA39I7B7_9BILA|nr:hypothetical protein QR680_013982 [Steinernema hermaphroditum]
MTRETFSLLLLLGLLAQGGHAAKPDVNQQVLPCDDLFGHVCIHNDRMEKFTNRRKYGLLQDVITVMWKRSIEDPIYHAVWKAMKKERNLGEEENKKCRLKNIDIDEKDFLNGHEHKIGKAFGKMVAYGRFSFENGVHVGPEVKGGPYVVKFDNGDHSDNAIVEKSSFDEIDNDFVRGIVEGFYGELPDVLGKLRQQRFIYHNLRAHQFKSIILGPTMWENRSSRMTDVGRYGAIFMSPTFAAYGNVLLAHTLYSYKADLNPAVADELTELTNRLMKEIENTVEKSPWLSPDDRSNIINYHRKSKVIIGIEEKCRDLNLLKRMMETYHAEFKKVKSEDECQMEMLSRAHSIARHKLIYSGVGSVASFTTALHHEFSLFLNNVFRADDTIHVFPGHIHSLNDYQLSTGFKYGHIVWPIATRIFRGLGVTGNKELDHLKGVMETGTLQRGKQCLLDFYREKQFCMRSNLCPNAAHKIDEGFSDIEGARVVFSILQETLQQSKSQKLPVFNWRLPGAPEEEIAMSNTSGFSEEQWFFIGIQAVFCDAEDSEDAHLRSTQPRPQIRANAIVQQMAPFTGVFECKKGDRNYMAKKQCGLHAPTDGSPEGESEVDVEVHFDVVTGAVTTSGSGDDVFGSASTLLALLCTVIMCLL